ncbi:hypothetical protein V8Z74_17085 [Comamonas sp. w2-DMI]|uniref:hypothetical protein n=1 Tax=Comamonas sp. w2-DMI TaxID=3126391 RepID=UPI0032E3AE4A
MGHRSSWDDDGFGFWLKLVMFGVLVWIGYEAYRHWEARQAVPEPVRARPEIPGPVPQAPVARNAYVPPAPRPIPRDGQVYRCGNTYSQQPCGEGGKAISIASVLTDPSASASREIYLCKDIHDQLYWESTPCSLRGRTIDRIARVPADVSWDQQVAIARAQRDKAQAIAAEQIVPVAPRALTQKSNAGECQALEGVVRWADRECRVKACNMDELDAVREERRKARDRQFRLGC